MNISSVSFGLSMLVFTSMSAHAAQDPCETLRTQNHYAQSRCIDIPRPISSTDPTEFRLRASVWAKDLSLEEQQTSIILIPGGPGGDSESLRFELNRKDILNALWAHLPLNVVLFDPRGTGHSQLQKSAEFYHPSVFSTAERVKDLRALIKTISPNRPVILLAHSEGGGSATRLAAESPELVKGLILVSALLDAREVAESNLILLSETPAYFENFFLTKMEDKELGTKLWDKFLSLNFHLSQYQKALFMDKVTSSTKRPFGSIQTFRQKLVLAIENDPTGLGRVRTFIEREYAQLVSLPEAERSILPEWLALKAQVSLNLKRSEWLRTAGVCYEGFKDEELQQPTYLTGVTMGDMCLGYSKGNNETNSLAWTKTIKAPTIWIGGTEDWQSRPSHLLQNAAYIANSKIKMIKGAGHISFSTHPFEFYAKGIEPFIIDLVQNPNHQVSSVDRPQ